MKKIAVIELYNAIDSALSIKGLKTKFQYGILKNKDIINPIILRLQEIEKTHAEVIKDYNEERNAIIMKYGKDNGHGQVIIPVTDLESSALYAKENELLLIKYKEQMDSFNELQKDYTINVLNEEIDEELTFFKIKLEQFPEPLDSLIFETLYKNGIVWEEEQSI